MLDKILRYRMVLRAIIRMHEYLKIRLLMSANRLKQFLMVSLFFRLSLIVWILYPVYRRGERSSEGGSAAPG